jgi:hypothetical protein
VPTCRGSGRLLLPRVIGVKGNVRHIGGDDDDDANVDAAADADADAAVMRMSGQA